MLPSVDELLRHREVLAFVEREGRPVVTEAARRVLGRLRQQITEGLLDEDRLGLALANVAAAIERQLREDLTFSLVPVINATGVVLHTNLGRAPLPEAAIERLRQVATGYSNLEFDIASGERGKRDIHADRLFRRLFQSLAEPVSTVVVNNNAAAVLLLLNTLGEGGEVIVSRGELVEIGGSFRVPDVMSKSGATLREVGTTNRTRISDYEHAINERTRLLLRVHRSNFEIVGFTEQPSLSDLVDLGRARGIPVVEDLGSGALFDLHQIGISGETTVHDSLRSGAGVVTYSGDKLLGGPQAGILTGHPDLIARVRANPLFRALRVDKLTYGVLETTLLAYISQQYDNIPAVRMMRLSPLDIAARAESLAASVRRQAPRIAVEVVAVSSIVGGGSAPGATLPSFALALSCKDISADELSRNLRQAELPIVSRVEEGRVLLDLRTVFPEQDQLILQALACISSASS